MHSRGHTTGASCFAVFSSDREGACSLDGERCSLGLLDALGYGERSLFYTRLSDGGVWCWGWNVYGQLGDGTMTTRSTPVAVVW